MYLSGLHSLTTLNCVAVNILVQFLVKTRMYFCWVHSNECNCRVLYSAVVDPNTNMLYQSKLPPTSSRLLRMLVVLQFQFQCSLSVVSDSVTPWTAARQPSLSITNSWSLLKLMPIESVMPSSHLILCHPFSFSLQSFPASGPFQMNQLFASGGQSTGVSASTSVLPMNIQD